MKRILILSALLIITSCNNKNEKKDENSATSDTTYSQAENSNPYSGKVQQPGSTDNTATSSETKEIDTLTSTPASTKINGNYINKDEASDSGCSCYCINIQFTQPAKLCISPNKIYINARYEQTKTDTINVYYTSAVNSNTGGKDIPWDKFDTTVPIAKIAPAAGGEIALDWLGFTIDGDLAIDYAIYGKKTLEGTYKKN